MGRMYTAYQIYICIWHGRTVVGGVGVSVGNVHDGWGGRRARQRQGEGARALSRAYTA